MLAFGGADCVVLGESDFILVWEDACGVEYYHVGTFIQNKVFEGEIIFVIFSYILEDYGEWGFGILLGEGLGTAM